MDEIIEKKKVSTGKTRKLDVSLKRREYIIRPPLMSSGVVASLLVLFLRREVK